MCFVLLAFLPVVASCASSGVHEVPVPTVVARRVDGVQRVSLTVAGRERAYYLHRPPHVVEPPRVVVFLHGAGGTAIDGLAGLPVSDAADRHGFVAVYREPVQYPPCTNDDERTCVRNATKRGGWWNVPPCNAGPSCESPATLDDVDDVAFVNAAVSDAVRRSGLKHPTRLLFGESLGAMMALHIACHGNHDFAAIVAIEGTLTDGDCPVRHPAVTVLLNALDDSVVIFAGTSTQRSVADTLSILSTGYRCTTSTKRTYAGLPAEQAGGCASGVTVTLATVARGGHEWARYPNDAAWMSQLWNELSTTA